MSNINLAEMLGLCDPVEFERVAFIDVRTGSLVETKYIWEMSLDGNLIQVYHPELEQKNG